MLVDQAERQVGRGMTEVEGVVGHLVARVGGPGYRKTGGLM